MNKVQNGLSWVQRVAGSVLMAVALLVVSILTPATVSKAAEQTKNTAEYYQAVENAYLNKAIDEFTKSYGTYIENYKKMASGFATEGTFKVALDSSLAEALGLKNFRSVRADVDTKQTDKKVSSFITYYYNDLKIITLDFLYDLEKDLYYLMIPEFSKAYLQIPASSTYNQSGLALTAKNIMNFYTSDTLSEDLLNRLLKKYTKAVLGEIKEVRAMEYLTTAGDISETQTMYTVEADTELMLNIFDSILNTAKLDKDLEDLFVSLKVCTAEEYQGMIDILKTFVTERKKALSDKDNETLFKMNVWVDSEGIVTGREIVIPENYDTVAFGYKALKRGVNTGINVWLSVNEEESLRLNGTISDESGKYNGNMTLSYVDTKAEIDEKFDISIEDVYTTIKDSVSFVNGKIVVTGKSMPGYKIEIGLSGNETQQTITADLLQETKKLVAITLTSKVVPYEDFDLPTEKDQIYNIYTELDDYIEGVDIDSFINDISNKIDLNGLDSLLKKISIQANSNSLDMYYKSKNLD